jgi:phage-related protein
MRNLLFLSGLVSMTKFINSLSVQQKRKVIRLLNSIEEYGLSSAISHVKKLTGTSLWEIRLLGQDNIRVLYCLVLSDSILVLHGFLKKTQQTPSREIDTALSRFREWIHRQERT